MRRLTREQREAQAERALKRDGIMRRMEETLEQAQAGIVFLATQEELTGGANTRWRAVLKQIDAVIKEARA